MRHVLRAAVLLSLAAVASLGIAAFTYIHRVYIAELSSVDEILDSLPPTEAHPPETFRRVVLAVESEFFESWVARSLISRSNPHGLRTMDWHARSAVWVLLLPRHLAQSQMLALYAHFLPFEGGSGLEYGAQLYYSKSAADLSEREVIGLLAISRSPHRNSPTKHPEQFEKAVQYLLKRLGSPAA